MIDTDTLQVPFIQAVNTFVYLHFVVPAQAVQLAHVGQLAQRTVRFRRIPAQFPLEADFLHDFLRHFADRHFLTRTHVDVAVTYFRDAVRILLRCIVCLLEIHVQQHVYAGICHLLTPQELTHRFSRTPECDCFRRNAELRQFLQNLLVGIVSVHPFHRTQVDVLAHRIPVTLIQALGQVNLADHGRQHMAVLQMEVIVRTVKVGRHYGNVVRAILQVKTLAHLQSRNLRDGIRFVRIFQRRGEEHLLLHRLRSLTRINARAAQKQQFFHPVAETLSNHVLLNLQVLVDKVRTVLQVGHDAPHVCSRQNHRIRLFLVEERLNCHRIQQVQLLVRTSHQVIVAPLLQVVPDSGTHQSVVSRYIYLSRFVQHNKPPLTTSRFPFPDTLPGLCESVLPPFLRPLLPYPHPP